MNGPTFILILILLPIYIHYNNIEPGKGTTFDLVFGIFTVIFGSIMVFTRVGELVFGFA